MNSCPQVGFVAIGRNEGNRLERCLESILKHNPDAPVIYVDSGSTDNSVNFARSLNCEVVELDMSIPFTAARARNTGYRKLLELHSNLEFVQFLDGDCELNATWVEAGTQFLNSHGDVGVCSGRRTEKFPRNSIYNQMIDLEWDTPIGYTAAVLGDMLVRVVALKSVNGFNDSIIAAEDDDFCIRAAAAGFSVYRLDSNMSLHDANILHISQWFRRSMRGGHGFANLSAIHPSIENRYFARSLYSCIFWGGVVPLILISSLLFSAIAMGALLVFYFLMIIRLAVRVALNGQSPRTAICYALLIYTGKIAEFFGVLRYWKNQMLSRSHQLIEYK